MAKSIIVYYSRAGNNYVNGNIVNLAVGNTKVVAQKIAALTGTELFEVQTVIPYPEDYTETTQVARKELKQNVRPQISGIVTTIAEYDVIYLGYPNWWGTMPMALFTFLESHDLAGKTVVPFCTHEGSGMGRSEKDIKKLCPKANVLSGLAIKGGNVAEKQITTWLQKLNLN